MPPKRELTITALMNRKKIARSINACAERANAKAVATERKATA